MRVRITGGVWKGRALVAPKAPALRPTSQKARQALFNIWGARLPGARVLDLFAGSGALGIEAVSRGASTVVFVERNPACTRAIRESLTRFGLPPGVTVEILTQEALIAIRRLERGRRLFDFILVDPPYEGFLGRKSLRALAQHAILAPSGVVVVEHAQRFALPETVEGEAPGRCLRQVRLARYGDTALAFYEGMTEA